MNSFSLTYYYNCSTSNVLSTSVRGTSELNRSEREPDHSHPMQRNTVVQIYSCASFSIFFREIRIIYHIKQRYFLAIDSTFLNFSVKLFHNTRNVLPFFQNYSAVNRPLIVSAYILPENCIAVALHSFIHKFPITQRFQLRIYRDIQEQIKIVRNVTKHSYMPVVKSLVPNNGQT